ncbi:16S rRNA (guanine(527)-N(7))-methyltransferase RsmG [Clostridium sp. BJN0001]|uniref:16S rRNA (guanine(527)-N(7))-methyltransferase RsmG n=1 Tax=Clostridium sp. BJN0001 TaxID=2930219 RepID=UPI001FD292DE|nr:16S rRNA (guanine(527)-N(7))-methyltransferase RsmG [Clostridium sp. BJN0001]
MDYFDLMTKAANDVGMDFDREKYDKFMKYKELLKEWNEKVNLTAIIDDEGIIKKHFIDSIKAFSQNEFKEAKTIIDVGTGAGFPGIPIAIMRDDVDVTLLDSLNKRIKFLDIVIDNLKLKNIKTIHKRAEDGGRDINLREKFDIATSRAVANMSVLSEFCLPYVKLNGNFIALKGPSVDDEITESKKAFDLLGGKLIKVEEVKIEDTDLKHNLVVVKKIKLCPKVYPRKAGTASKKPIR